MGHPVYQCTYESSKTKSAYFDCTKIAKNVRIDFDTVILLSSRWNVSNGVSMSTRTRIGFIEVDFVVAVFVQQLRATK